MVRKNAPGSRLSCEWRLWGGCSAWFVLIEGPWGGLLRLGGVLVSPFHGSIFPALDLLLGWRGLFLEGWSCNCLLLLSWKIPLNWPCPLFHTHLIGLDHFYLLLSQATAVQSVPDSSTFFIWIYWIYPACLGHSLFVSALVSSTTLCPWLSVCVYSDLCPSVAVGVFCLPWYCFPQVINKASY